MRATTLLLLLAGCFGSGDDGPRIVPDTDLDPVFQGIVEVSPSELVISGAVPGERIVGIVQVGNVGEYDLTVRSAVLVDDAEEALVTDEATNADRVISPGRLFEVLVRCTLPVDDTDTDSVQTVEGLLDIQTSDPATPSVDVPVRCTTDG